MKKTFITVILTALLSTTLFSCSKKGKSSSSSEDEPVKIDKDISIVYTTDVHCGIDKYLGYSKVESYKKSLENSINAINTVEPEFYNTLKTIMEGQK